MVRDVPPSNHTNALGSIRMIIYLYIKQHSITKLKYFGKTTSKNPFKYPGSGTYWKNHTKKHGKEYVKTIELWGFDDQELCTEFALKFSEDNNIVESKEWANKIPEDGLNGWQTGDGNPSKTSRNRHRMKTQNPMSKLRINRGSFEPGHKPVITSERNLLISLSKIGSKNPNYKNTNASSHLNISSHVCKYCGIITTIGNIIRWHNDKCKLKS